MDDPIDHVVVLMLENHSFDQMLGSLSTVIGGLNGIDPKQPRSNPDFPDSSKLIFQSETKLTSIPLDPAHEFVDVNHQLSRGMTGFISGYVQAHPNCTSDEKNQIMGYYPVDFLPVLHCLAKNSSSAINGSHLYQVRRGQTGSSSTAGLQRDT